MDERTVWTAHKYVSNDPADGGKTRIPNLTYKGSAGRRRYTTTNEEKAKAFYNTFFAAPDESSHAEIGDNEYLEPAFKFRPISDHQISRAINRISPCKAPRANGFSNIILKQCADLIIPIIGPIFHATFSLNTYPEEWKNSITLVVRKPAKASYVDPGAYRPIALLDTIGKVLSACVAEDLSKYAEIHNLLPRNHFGCRPR
jgi:hypothetical protein